MSRALPEWLTHASAGLLVLAVLVATGQPLFTDDLWWHLGLGRAFAAEGPRLADDPLLFAAPGPPPVRSWLADAGLFQLLLQTGFQELRVAHALAVALLIALAWRLLVRASGSAWIGSALVALFATAAAYRLVQLRPQLFTLAAALLLYRLLIHDGKPPGALRIAFAALLSALWANLHAGFPLGPGLVMAAAAGIGSLALFGATSERGARTAHAARLCLAAALMAVASLANPDGAGAYGSLLSPGVESPGLTAVLDEWRAFPLFELPGGLPPSPLSWSITWLALLALPLVVPVWRRAARSETDPSGAALAGVALASGVLLIGAVRFVWLAIFPLLLVARILRGVEMGSAGRWGCAAASLSLIPAFFWLGDWPKISGAIGSPAQYALPYPAAKYFAHAIWLMSDAEVEGNLYASYTLGGFAGYWLAPRVRTLTNGSLNVAPDALAVNGSIRAREGWREGESFLELLDHQEIDLFLGTGLPEIGPDGQTRFSTTRHLEGALGWKLVFRNLRSAVYLRDNERNRGNLERIAAYYDSERIPFDPAVGFDAARVFDEEPSWSAVHGMVPHDLAASISRARRERNPAARALLLDRIATVYAILGLYERAAAVDRRLLALDPTQLGLRRRRLWTLFHLGRFEEAAAIARDSAQDADSLVAAFASIATGTDADSQRARRQSALLPLLTQPEGQRLLRGYIHPEARAPRPEPAER